MTTHETSINPFHIPDGNFINRQSNVAEADENDDQFGHLERKPKDAPKSGLGQITEEKLEQSMDSADAPTEEEG